uniref:Gnk2-homologous domain-containing protein n=1 Tax=Quercus lobata TaxID=97700 RepID=A0A7N2L8S7_QUELO
MPQRQTFKSNFLAAMDSVTPLIATQRFAAVLNGTGHTTVYAFAVRGGKIFYDGCYLRYDDYYFFNETLSVQDKTVCGAQEFVGNGSVFSANVNQLVMNLSVETPKFDDFSVGSVNNGNVTVYGLAQCWEFVNGTACEDCLANAVSNISSCTPKQEGGVLNSGCYSRHSTDKFYYNSTQPIRNSSQVEFGSNEFFSFFVLSFLHRIKWDISVLSHAILELLSFLVVYKRKVTKNWDLN